MLHLQDEPLATRGRMWIQHDRATPRVVTEVAEYGNENNQGWWIGRSGLVTSVVSIKPVRLFPVGLHGVNIGITEQPAQCIVEDTTHLRNEMERIQWEHVYSHKAKCKFTLEENMKAQKGRRFTTLLFL